MFLETHNDILKLYSEKQLKNEFDAIELYSEIHKDNIPKECRLRRYLALTYSSLQRELDKQSKLNWRWSRWINNNKNNIKFAISFNYDLLLESTFKVNNINYYRVGSNETELGIPVIKPHGSIDFDIQQPHFKTFSEQLEISNRISSNYFSLNQVDGIIQAIPSTHWLLPRLQADIIPPSQFNYQRHLDWVDKGFLYFDSLASNVTDLVIIGHSYSTCDRDEIDHFLSQIPLTTKVQIINPNPPSDLISKIKSLNLKYIVIDDFITMPI